MIEAIFQYEFMQNAFIAGILASVICGIIGVIIVEKKLVMMSGGIAHTAYGGVGLGYLIGVEPITTATLFAIFAAFGIGYIERRGKAGADVITAMFWSLGMALGIAFVGFMPSYPPDMNSYLFGNILTVTRTDLAVMLLLAAVILILTLVFYSDLKSFLFDERFAAISGIKTTLMEYILLLLVALTVVVLIRVAGIILVIALLSAPAASAAMITARLKTRMAFAALFSAFFCIAGLFISYALGIASGATIVFVAVLTYIVIFVVRFLKKRIA